MTDDEENNTYFTDPFESDSDSDGESDGDEVSNGTDPNDPASNSGTGGTGGGGMDSDGDGLSDDDEDNLFGTNPFEPDTDGDTYDDGQEIDAGTDPNDPDWFPGSSGSGSEGGSGDPGDGGSSSGGAGSSTGDDDGDGIPNDWEIQHGLNPDYFSDAGRDYDYDRMSNLDEYQADTTPNTHWNFVEIAGGVPLHAIDSLNGLGQLAKIVTETDAGGNPTNFRVQIWNRNNGWTASNSLGAVESNHPEQVRMNVRGMVAAIFRRFDASLNRWRGEVRVLTADGLVHRFGHDLNWGIVDRLKITESGFVVGRFQDFSGDVTTPSSKVFRWRNGWIEILAGSSANLYPQDVNEQGEIIDRGEGVFRRGEWEWLGSPPLGINDRSEVWITGSEPEALGIGMWSLASSYPIEYQFNNLTDSFAGLGAEIESQLENFKHFFDQPATPGDDPIDLVSFIDGTGAEMFLTDPVSDPHTTYRRIAITSSMNDLGDAIGWFLSHQSESGLGFDDPDGLPGETIMVPEPEGYLWRGGNYSLLGGIDQGSRFRSISNAGHILVSALRVEPVEVEENIGDVDGDGFDDYQTVTRDALLTRWGMLMPQNDADNDGLPDDWESNTGVTNPAANDDDDDLTALEEYALMTDPGDVDSDNDELPDQWEIENGSNPNEADADDDIDGDGLSAAIEFREQTDAARIDSDGDGFNDFGELLAGTNPNDPVPSTQSSGNPGNTSNIPEPNPDIAALQVRGRAVVWTDDSVFSQPPDYVPLMASHEFGIQQIPWPFEKDAAKGGAIGLFGGTLTDNWVTVGDPGIPMSQYNPFPGWESPHTDEAFEFGNPRYFTVDSWNFFQGSRAEFRYDPEGPPRRGFFLVRHETLQPTSSWGSSAVEVVQITNNPEDPKTAVVTPQLVADGEARVTLQEVDFDEVELETGYDDFEYRDFGLTSVPDPPERPMLSISAEGDIRTELKLRTPVEANLTLETKQQGSEGANVAVDPTTTSGSNPQIHEFGGLNYVGISAWLELEEGRVMDFYGCDRLELDVAVHVITLTNDDIDSGIEIGKGEPNSVCISPDQNPSLIFTNSASGDDVRMPTNIKTGPDGICNTTAHQSDSQDILVGKGLSGATLITAGPNGKLNSIPSGDDEKQGETITTGPDGIRNTSLVVEQIAPENVPTAEEIEEQLNSVFGRQCNVFFDVVQYSEADAAFEVEGDGDGLREEINGNLDIHFSAQSSAEEDIVKAASPPVPGVINVYLVPTRIRSLGNGDIVAGHAKSILRTPYVSAIGFSKPTILHSISHEIGHLRLLGTEGLKHPWQYNGSEELVPWPWGFPLTDEKVDETRLMWPDIKTEVEPTLGRPRARLLSREWEVIRGDEF